MVTTRRGARKAGGLPLDNSAFRTYLGGMARKLSTPNRTKAIGYVRVSSKVQAAEGRSLEDQRDAIIRHAVLNGMELVDVLADGGISGGKDEEKRPGLAAALDALRAGRASVLIVKHVDRLSRDSDLAGFLKVTVKRAGGALVVLDDTEKSPMEKLFDQVVAEIERLRGSERMKFVYAAKKSKGEWVGPVPFGFRLGSDGALEAVEAEAPIVERILARHASGASLRAIAAELNADAVPTRTGKAWNPMTISGIVKRGPR